MMGSAFHRISLLLTVIGLGWCGGMTSGLAASSAVEAKKGSPLYLFTLTADGTPAAYDEAMAVASLQGIINRNSPELYVLSHATNHPQFWLDILTRDGHWLEGRKQKTIADLDALVKLAGKRLKGAVIWDPAVPASLNVATTFAGVYDAIVLSPELAERHLTKWRLPVLKDFRGRFTGAETGSAKNDAYRWAIREMLGKGLCSAHRLCLYEDAFTNRAAGDISYVLTRDWAVKNRAFVFDLSPWGDEKPGDDPAQRPGTDLETYQLILAETLRHSAGKEMTEITGFSAMDKYSRSAGHASVHDGVPTEWETVWLMTPYNCYQNTISSGCYNQSLHSQAPHRLLGQDHTPRPMTLTNKAYICILMADYDSATPLYDFLPDHWRDPDRGKIPLAWGINPSLLETYPDVFAYFYETASTNDYFTSDASAAGYMNPNRIQRQYLHLFVEHNRHYFQEADMSIAPMVLDRDQPSPEVKDAFQQFAPDGYATIVADVLGRRGTYPAPQVWKGMPIMELHNDTCNSWEPGNLADIMSGVIGAPKISAEFYLFRCVWLNPSNLVKAMAELHRKRPDLNFEVLDPFTFFASFKKLHESSKATP